MGVFWVCCRNSSSKDSVPHSSRSAFVRAFTTFDGVSEFACFLFTLTLGGLRFLAGQASGSVTADIDELLVQGSGEHGTFSSLLVGMGQAAGRVDVPDGAKVEAAAACSGTLRSRPGKIVALGSVQSRKVKVQFFLKEYMMGIPGLLGATILI